MHRTSLREGVADSQFHFTPQFLTWAQTALTGHYSIETDTPNKFIQFELADDLATFALVWTEEYVAKITINKRVMPTIIATNIIGVSPLTGPVDQVQLLRERYNPQYSSVIKDQPKDV